MRPEPEAAESRVPKILIIAGDTSGDIHCSLLAREILARHPGWRLFAAGGEHLEQAGCEMIASTRGMGVIGFASVLSLLPRALLIRRRVKSWLARERPQAVVLCDWGAFNVRLLPHLREARLRESGLRSLYYFPPRSWQKTGAGGLGIAPACDCIATPFEWSARRLNEAGGHAFWVGHPLLEIVAAAPSRQQARSALGLSEAQVLVALLPGSRDLELRLIGPAMAGAARIIQARDANVRFVAAVPRGSGARARKYLPGIEVREGEAASLLKACDAALVKSGTATLEAAVADAPQVVAYDVPAVVRAQYRWTLQRKMRHVSMPNIILERALVPEMLGDNCRAEPLARELQLLLDDPAKCHLMRKGYQEVRRALGAELGIGATARTVDLLEKMLG